MTPEVGFPGIHKQDREAFGAFSWTVPGSPGFFEDGGYL